MEAYDVIDQHGAAAWTKARMLEYKRQIQLRRSNPKAQRDHDGDLNLADDLTTDAEPLHEEGNDRPAKAAGSPSARRKP